MVIRVYLKSTFIYFKFCFVPTCQAVVQPRQVNAGKSKAGAAFNLPREYKRFQLLHHLLTIVEDFSRAHFLIPVQVANVVVRFADGDVRPRAVRLRLTLHAGVHSGANHHRPLFQRCPRRHVNLAIFRVSHHNSACQIFSCKTFTAE